MVDTTRPFHWGRENPNYAGPQRAQPASESVVSGAPLADFPDEEPLEKVTRIGESLDPDAVITAAGVRGPGASLRPGPDFSSMIPVATELVEEYVDDNPGAATVDADEIFSGYSFGTRAEEFMVATGRDAFEHAAGAENPSAELAEVAREYGFDVTADEVREHMVDIMQMYARNERIQAPEDYEDVRRRPDLYGGEFPYDPVLTGYRAEAADYAAQEAMGVSAFSNPHEAEQVYTENLRQGMIDAVARMDDGPLYRHYVESDAAWNTRDIKVTKESVSVYDMALMTTERDAKKVLRRAVTEIAEKYNSRAR